MDEAWPTFRVSGMGGAPERLLVRVMDSEGDERKREFTSGWVFGTWVIEERVGGGVQGARADGNEAEICTCLVKEGRCASAQGLRRGPAVVTSLARNPAIVNSASFAS